MAQPSPLRNRTLYGASDGTIFPDQGSAEGWQRAGRPASGAPATPTPSAAPPTAPSVGMTPGQASERIGQRLGRYASRTGSAFNVGLGAVNEIAGPGGLAETARTQGTDAAMAQAPNALGRVAGSEVGMQLGAKVGSKLPGLWKVPGVVGGAALGNYLGRQGGDQAVSGLQRLNAGPYSKALDMGDTAASAVSPSNIASTVNRGVRGFLNADGTLSDRFSAGLAGAVSGTDVPAPGRELRSLAGTGTTPPTPTPTPTPTPAGSRPTTGTRPLTSRARTPGLPATTPNDPRVAKASAPSPYDAPPQSMRDFGQQLAAQYAAQPQMVAAPSDTSGQIGLRARTQGGIIANPNAMSAVDRIASLGNDPRLKGSPSLRRMVAEQIMAEDGRVDANHQAELNANQAADATQAQLQANARDAFANRRLKADMFNTDTTEGRRTGDLDRGLKASMFDVSTSESRRKDDLDRLVTAALGRVRGTRSGVGASGSATGTNGDDFANGNYTDIAKKYGGDYNQDAVSTWKNAVDAGEDPSASPLGRIAMTRMQDANAEALREMGRRWFASTPQNVSTDPRDAIPVDRDWVDKLSTIWPGGIDSNDYKYRDAKTGEEYYSAQAPFASADQTARARSLRDAFRTPAK